tara:strand:+ start:51 stop:188 length:138 start_codon:yes stop_codon:yes gene_type:complete
MVPKGAKPKPAKLAKEKKEVRAMSWSEILAKINHYVSVHGKLPGN